MRDWLGLMIGNSRLHWALFVNNALVSAWDTNHLSVEIDFAEFLVGILSQQSQELISKEIKKKIQKKELIIYLASVVPEQTLVWQDYSAKKVLAIADLPLKGTYPSLGIDRALAVCGAGANYGYPCLVIDAGTALTFTGVDQDKNLIGGAILPGLGLQLRSLHQQTAALPQVDLATALPSRWSLATKEAISSGIVYTLLAGINSYIEDWLAKYPDSQVIFTGGDSPVISQHFNHLYPQKSRLTTIDQKLIFEGLKLVREILVD